MSFCRYCGKELVNNQCDCPEFRASVRNAGSREKTQYQEAYQKTRDPFIVTSFKPDFSSISGFVSSIRDQSGMSEPSSNYGDPYEHNVPIIPDCIQPAKDEIVVKQYNVAKLRSRLRFMKAEGRLMVTNKRVLFRAAGTSLTGNVLYEQEFNLDEIGGVEIDKGYEFSKLNFIGCLLLYILTLGLIITFFSGISSGGATAIGVILGMLGLVPTLIVYKRFGLKLFCAMVSSVCFLMVSMGFKGSGFLAFLVIIANIIVLLDLIIVCFVPSLEIEIKTKGAAHAVTIGYGRSKFYDVMPWEDTIMAINELGTMIDDLQKQGNYAIEKWSNQ